MLVFNEITSSLCLFFFHLLLLWSEFASVVESPEQSETSSSGSQDTIILSESPSAKRQRLDTEAKHVRINSQKLEKKSIVF